MGNALLTGPHRIACGHTDRGMLRQSLLFDRLSQPTADMVEGLLALQDQTVLLQQFSQLGEGHNADRGTQPFLLLSMAFCILFGYRCERTVTDGHRGSRDDPIQPNEFVAAFNLALTSPQAFIQDLLALRAQVVPKEKLMRLAPLVDDGEGINPSMFGGPYGEVLRNLAVFVRATFECAQIYAEIRELVAIGKIDATQSACLLEGVESDQKRMIDAMGGGTHGDENDMLYVAVE
mmetsp:Transcript_49897/g.96345  ORF Transcript_49897/g.96345 Transcript_49897/m.96345 type:complete len:234 (+) Transcript_49897:74-775(+)